MTSSWAFGDIDRHFSPLYFIYRWATRFDNENNPELQPGHKHEPKVTMTLAKSESLYVGCVLLSSRWHMCIQILLPDPIESASAFTGSRSRKIKSGGERKLH